MLNFASRVLPHKKFQYQEGKEVDVRFLCGNGVVTGGFVVIASKSRFLEQAIIKERNKQTGENIGKPVELDFKFYSKQTVKTFLDMVYEVNVTPITANIGVSLIHFLAQSGHYKTDGKDDFPGTTQMIEDLAETIKPTISDLSTLDRIDLGLALMIIPIDPALMLANECLDDIPEIEFLGRCYELITSTDYFEMDFEEEMVFKKEEIRSVGIIAQYLHGVTKNGISGKQFRTKFHEITNKIRTDLYGPGNDHKQSHWTEIDLFTCGLSGRTGPSLEKCIKWYHSWYGHDWFKNKDLFNVDSNRPGIQQITIPKSGLYEVTACGAGNYTETGSGAVIKAKHKIE